MRTAKLVLFACCVAGCAAQGPLDGVAETSTEDLPTLADQEREPVQRFTAPDDMSFLAPTDGEFADNEYASLSCYVRLVYCHDPRYVPHYPSFCQNGCSLDYAFSVARSLCRSNCGDISCANMWYLGNCY